MATSSFPKYTGLGPFRRASAQNPPPAAPTAGSLGIPSGASRWAKSALTCSGGGSPCPHTSLYSPIVTCQRHGKEPPAYRKDIFTTSLPKRARPPPAAPTAGSLGKSGLRPGRGNALARGSPSHPCHAHRALASEALGPGHHASGGILARRRSAAAKASLTSSRKSGGSEVVSGRALFHSAHWASVSW